MTNKEKRYVEVKKDERFGKEAGFKHDLFKADQFGIFNEEQTLSLPELILKEHPDIREESARAVWEISHGNRGHKWEDYKEAHELFFQEADSILSILGIKKEG